MSARLRVAFAFALGLLAADARAQAPASSAPRVRVQVSGADDRTLVVSDAQGVVNASDDVAPGAPRGTANVDLAYFADGFYETSSRLGTAISIELQTTVQPLGVESWTEEEQRTLAVYRFPPTLLVEGRRVRIDVAADGRPSVRHDSDGDGEPETTLAPAVELTGEAANDRTPPVVTHERLPDGRHALALTDSGVDITSGGELFVSIDNGERFFPYPGPLELDPWLTPVLMAIGKDRAGNASDSVGFSTQPPFCDRVARDRSELAIAIGAALSGAVAQGELPSADGVAVLATGRAACLWRTGFLGSDLSCEACEGVYVPSFDEIELEVYLPDAVAVGARGRVAELVAARVDEPVRRLGEARVVARARSELDGASLGLARSAGDRDAGLARQLGLLRSLATGEYVDLGATGPDVTGPSLSSLLSTLLGSGVPALEGFEAARRAELAMLASGVMVRVVGMGQRLVADAPEGDSHLGRTLRRQLEVAAEGALFAAGGVLAADVCARDNALLSTTRSAFQSDACGGAPCATFEAFLATQVAAAAGPCPAAFSEAERAALDAYHRLTVRDAAALEPIAQDDCTANASLGAALALSRQLGARARSAYDAGLAAADATERGQRESNAAAALGAISALQASPTLGLGVELANKSPNPLPELLARLYVAGVPTGQERRVSLAPGERSFSLGNAERNEPFFLRIESAQTPPNQPRAAVIVFDPENALGRTRRGPKLSGFSFYLFDPADPVCPPAQPLRLPPGVEVPGP